MTDRPDARPDVVTDDGGARADASTTSRDPDAYVQGEAVTLVAVLDRFAAEGFTGQFDAPELDAPSGAIRCLQCRETTPAAEIGLAVLWRLEGASDPADMLAVAAVQCPHCGARGTLILNYGPESTIEDAAVLGALPEAPDGEGLGHEPMG